MDVKKWIDDQILEECDFCSIHQYFCHLHGNDYNFYIFEYDNSFHVWLNRDGLSFMDFVYGIFKDQRDLDGTDYNFSLDMVLDFLNYHCHTFCDDYDDFVSKIDDFNRFAPGHYYE